MEKETQRKSTIITIKKCISALEDLVKELEDKKALKEETKELTLEDVRAVLADKARFGFSSAIKDILSKYGAEKLSTLDKAHYQKVLEEVKELGDGK